MVGHVPLFYFLTGEGITQIGNAPFSWSLTTDAQFLLQWPTPADSNLWDIRYLLTDQTQPPPPGATLLVHSGRNHLYRLASDGPFSLVSTPVAIAGDKESVQYVNLRWLKSPWPAARAHARLLLDGTVARNVPVLRMEDPFHYTADGGASRRGVFDDNGMFAQSPPPRPRGVVTDVFASRQAASATVAVPQPTVMLFKATYHPGWRAFIDGTPAATMLLSPGMIGVEVPAGLHSVRFEYTAGWSKGILLGLGVMLAIAIDLIRPRRRAARVAGAQ